MGIMKSSNRNFHAKGFTLIELLVVISIIGIFSSVVLASLNDVRTSALYSSAKTEMKLISDATLLINGNQSVMSITGNNCSDCVCRSYPDTRNIPDTDVCVTLWRSAITRVDAATPYINGVEPFMRDPWGSPYMLDENEAEHGPTDCYPDYLFTVGPDGQSFTADDFFVALPLRTVGCE